MDQVSLEFIRTGLFIDLIIIRLSGKTFYQERTSKTLGDLFQRRYTRINCSRCIKIGKFISLLVLVNSLCRKLETFCDIFSSTTLFYCENCRPSKKGGAQKMWYSCSKRATTGCKATACVVATSEEREDGSLLWTHQFEKVSSYEVTLSMILIIQALLLSLLFRTIASSMCLSLPRECRISSKISLGTERRGIPL